MPRHDHRCKACGKVFERLVKWDEREAICACGGAAERIYLSTIAAQDDTLPGGPRLMHNLGDTPMWVETKTELRRIMNDRGLVFAERAAYNKHDRSPWATRTRLRPGERDPFIHPVGFNA